MSLIYKTLFEVKLTHEYYHTASDGQTIFSLNNQPDRLSFLESEFEKGRPSILQDLDFRFPKSLEKFYSDQNIKLLPSYSGVKVLTRVRQTTLPDNSLVFEPFTLLPENIFIRIVKKNSAFASYTQSKIKEGLSAGYFFSSDTITSTKTFPFLTSDIS
ncbi:MAG: hypothetical protein JNK79_14035, partial [Chitinophagaceae bacterium]|nr:hypothetical protein [Chitinophagaceae bacterium]